MSNPSVIYTDARDDKLAYLEFGNKSLTIYTLTQHDDIKKLEKTLKLPENIGNSDSKRVVAAL